ncbi:hypothetical protein GCM10007112_07490 [Vulcanisaeta souniana JCM 11219]|nr:hypothetical protein GCM10007112_07490 [Vulcanisaeta souniana JCM 11219]
MRSVHVTLVDAGLQKPRYPLIHSKLLRFHEDITLSKISEEVYLELSRKLGIKVLQPMDSITVIPSECYSDTAKLINLWHEAGARVKVINDIGKYGLKKAANNEVYILSSDGDNLVNYVQLMRRIRKYNNVRYVEGKARVNVSNDSVEVVVNDRTLHGDYYIITAGAWNSTVARDAGLRVPLLPYKCQAAAFLSRRINYILYDYVLDIYMRPLGSTMDHVLGLSGLSIVVGGDGNSKTTEPGKEEGVDREFLNEVSSKVMSRLGNAFLIGSRFGYCEVTPDMRPAVGTLDLSNLVFMGGFDGYGAEVGPALALALTEYLFNGSWPGYAKPYLIDRFGNNWPSTWDISTEAHELCV